MAFLRQKIKQKIIEKQNKLYENEVSSKIITYEKWIAKEEKKSFNIDPICVKYEKNLTNELETNGFDGEKRGNDREISDEVGEMSLFSCIDQNSQMHEKTFFVLINVEKLYKNAKTVFGMEKLEYIMVSLCEGQVNKPAWQMVHERFCDPQTLLVYGDEDQLTQEEGGRKDPWLKPDWSPDRFLSGFYLGSLVTVRASALRKAWKKCCRRESSNKIPDRGGAKDWFYLLLFEMLKSENCFAKRNEKTDSKVCHLKHVLYNAKQNSYEQLKYMKLPDFTGDELKCSCSDMLEVSDENNPRKEERIQTLSIVIPSKDNPEVLFHCLDSLLEQTVSDITPEIIVVDNGSGEKNRERISRKLSEINRKTGEREGRADGLVVYLYEPMDFNFSRMCNLGAEKATGEVLLFLNDDMEIIQPDWMELMMEKALLPWAGAVGAKLLYPGSDAIQHAGITNLRVGPAHKLQYLSDQEEHYFGMNRGVHDMLAVTGACLMVRREVFREAGGFCEELAVAFNDVDLCYTIYEKGYYNIVRNDVKLYHHESLSRGKDGESEEKQLRHLREKDLLYERHLSLYGRDPFYHPWLLNDMLDSRYSMAYCNPVTLDMPWSRVVSCEKALKKAREDECLVVGMECARDIYRWLHSLPPAKGEKKGQPEDMGYYFQGYSFIIGANNACYRKKLLLQNKKNGQVLGVCADVRYRQDIRNNLPDQTNVGLTGFAAKLPKAAVPAGIYRFGILAEDRCSRQKLVNWSNWVMEVEADGRQSVREGKESGKENG